MSTTLVCLTVSSVFAFRQAEATAFYSAGRNYMAHGQMEDGGQWLKRSVEKGNNQTVPLEEAYVHLCMAKFLQASAYFNLGFGYATHDKDVGKTVSALEKAIFFNPAKRDLCSDVLTQLGYEFR